MRRALRPAFLTLLLILAGAVSGADYEARVQAKVILKTTVTSDGRKIAYPVTENPEVTAIAVEIPPGAETGWHVHPVPVYAWLVSGTLTVDLEGGKSNSYAAGDAIVEVVGTRHNGRNTGTVPAKLLVFYTGVAGEPVVRRTP